MSRYDPFLQQPPRLGASFSASYCRELGLAPRPVLTAMLKQLGVRRLRLMSYWNLHEPRAGHYDFSELDWQMDLAARYGARVSLCLGKRQPRWPECHMPAWALAMPKADWYAALYRYVATVVERYQDHPALESWQLENEALLRSFGVCLDGDYSHARLRHELAIVRAHDPQHPVIMTLSDNWGFPWRGPWPDIFGFSVYMVVMNKRGRYVPTRFAWWWHRLRSAIIRTVTGRPVILHELQAEPWGDRPLTAMSAEDWSRSMNPAQLARNLRVAAKIKRPPTYLWGLEWWYYAREQGRPEMWQQGGSYFKDV